MFLLLYWVFGPTAFCKQNYHNPLSPFLKQSLKDKHAVIGDQQENIRIEVCGKVRIS